MFTVKEQKLTDFSAESNSVCGASNDGDDGDEFDFVSETNEGSNGRKEVEQLTLKETRNMRVLKAVVFLFILGGAAVVSAGTYFFVQKTETEEFEHTYDQFADTIAEAMRFHVAGLTDALQAQANWLTSEAAERNQTFPYVTIGSFEVEGFSIRTSSKVQGVVFTPLVDSSTVAAWNDYSVNEQGWIEKSRDTFETSPEFLSDSFVQGDMPPYVYSLSENGSSVPTTLVGTDPLAPWWQMSPPPYDPATNLNFDTLSNQDIKTLYDAMETSREAVFGPVADVSYFDDSFARTVDDQPHNDGDRIYGDSSYKSGNDGHHHRRTVSEEKKNRPRSILMQPVYKELYNNESPIVGMLHAVVTWDSYMVNLLPRGIEGIQVVLANDCGQAYTYELDGPDAMFSGSGDLHQEPYDDDEFRKLVPFSDLEWTDAISDISGHCSYSFTIYPTDKFEAEFRTPLPLVLTIIVGSTFLLMVMTFGAYDFFVMRRNRKIVDAAAKFNAIVSSLFPENVRKRLFAQADEKMDKKKAGDQFDRDGAHNLLKDFMADGNDMDLMDSGEGIYMKSKPIADLFPETSILFADIAGFTAWSSAREPAQVFMLLESIYACFDKIAKRRGIYKVETIGDCYVAVVGLPEPRSDHAVAMTRFARDCMHSMQLLVRKLEVSLGPDTADLSMRIGIHSGPVTAGVLRGERSRFQLFGDTMNTASRMESTGLRDKIQISQETAELLYTAGKSSWVVPREEKIVAKGKGALQTYWVLITSPRTRSSNTGGTDESETVYGQDAPTMSEKILRSIRWNTDILGQLLREVQANRGDAKPIHLLKEDRMTRDNGKTVLEEVKEIIHLPPFAGKTSDRVAGTASIKPEALDQLHYYVTAIATLYRNNPFHNFEHASHVTMSVTKLLSRITAPDLGDTRSMSEMQIAAKLHESTYGIKSDPLTQFACVFSALIHDIEHSGVPNTQLLQENPTLAHLYKNKSVAEQNSVDLAWSLLMDDMYTDLREAIYQTPAEKMRFRQLVVNAVLATDIMDQDLKKLRNNRWERSFAETREESPRDVLGRKATIVIEHMIQASDVAHTMQHWHTYRKWNACLFQEMNLAYLEGRAESDPAEYWYQGELGFFDYYIIPMAKKLKDCGVFGVSSDEYLNYAMKNRREWEQRGHEIVAEMVEEQQQIVA